MESYLPDLIVRGQRIQRGLPWWRDWRLAPLVSSAPADPCQAPLPFPPTLYLVDGGLADPDDVERPHELPLPLQARFRLLRGGRRPGLR